VRENLPEKYKHVISGFISKQVSPALQPSSRVMHQPIMDDYEDLGAPPQYSEHMDGEGFDRRRYQTEWMTEHHKVGRDLFGKMRVSETRKELFDDWHAEKGKGRKSEYWDNEPKVKRAPNAWQRHVKVYAAQHKAQILGDVLRTIGVEEHDHERDMRQLADYKKVRVANRPPEVRELGKQILQINKEVFSRITAGAKATYNKEHEVPAAIALRPMKKLNRRRVRTIVPDDE
jgi:hypothetical protein